MSQQLEPFFLVSQNLDCIGYKAKQLFIRFKSGVTYCYDDTPYDYFDALQKVESAGRFFSKFVRGKFHYTKLENDPFTAS